MERKPNASEATSAAAALFAWVRDSAPVLGPLGLRVARTLAAPGLGVGSSGLRGRGPSPALRLGWGIWGWCRKRRGQRGNGLHG